MLILAFDTSTTVASIALVEGDQVLFEVRSSVRASHGEALLPAVHEQLRAVGAALGDVDVFAVGCGPGSFTGTRIGVATAKGLAWAARKPLVGVGSLRVLARGAADDDGPRIVLTDAHKGEVYGALYLAEGASLRELVEPFHAPPAEALSRLLEAVSAAGPPPWLSGGAEARYADALGPLLDRVRCAPVEASIPSARSLAREAEARLRAVGPSDIAALEPCYVRPSDAKLPAR